MSEPRLIAVTLRAEDVIGREEVRDCLDQRWAAFLETAGFTPLLLPNHVPSARAILALGKPAGILLTGGGDLSTCGGRSHGREEVEKFLIELATSQRVPLLGVCRGMQALQGFFGQTLSPVEGHVAPAQRIRVHGEWADVNSYHAWGTREVKAPLVPWALAEDGVVKAIRHERLPLAGVMWHPERMQPFRADDVRFFDEWFT